MKSVIIFLIIKYKRIHKEKVKNLVVDFVQKTKKIHHLVKNAGQSMN